MQIRIMTNQCYNFVDPALGKLVEAIVTDNFNGKLYHVSVKELRRVGCTGVSGAPYPFYEEEVQVITTKELI